MQGNQRRVHTQGGKAGLNDTDYRRLPACLLQGGKAKLMADGKGNEAQGHIRDH